MTKRKIIVLVLLALTIFCCLSITMVESFVPTNSVSVYALTTTQNKQVQQKLKTLGYYKGAIDGIIGNQSKTAIRNFQRDYGLVVDGIVGPKTLKALGLSTSTNSLSSADIDLLAKCVYAEARGEPYTGQVAVAAVVLNRVKSASFPNTISGVIYQPYAFTSVNDGQIKLSPNQSAYNAAKDAMNGWDPTYGCLYYYNPATATSKWIWSRTVVVKIGKHSFAK